MGKSKLVPLDKKKSPGRPRLFTDPTQLLDLWQKYLAWNDANPMEMTNERGKYEIERPLSLLRFCLFAGIEKWQDFRDDYKVIDGFGEIISHIEGYVRNQQIEGAMIGKYKENLVARLNGISDKQEIKADVNAQRSVEDAYKALYGTDKEK